MSIFNSILAKGVNMVILKLNEHDEDREIEFELDYLASLTTRQRFQIMFAKTREMLSLLKKPNANRKVTEIIKRDTKKQK